MEERFDLGAAGFAEWLEKWRGFERAGYVVEVQLAADQSHAIGRAVWEPECDCLIEQLDGVGNHSRGCAVFRPAPEVLVGWGQEALW